MARPIWKGFISFGLVSIPVGLHSAIESREELSFHLLHKKDLSRVDYRRYCEKEDVEVPWLQASLKTDAARKDLAKAQGRGRRKTHGAKRAA